MTLLIGCLHTATSNIAVFEAAAEGMNISLRHKVRADLLALAEEVGGLTPGLADTTAAALDLLSREVSAVILTCSTLGPSIARAGSSIPVLRADAALARMAVRSAIHSGRSVSVLCAVATTLHPTQALFETIRDDTGADVAIDVRLVRGAWDLFRSGRMASYHRAIASAADEAFAAGSGTVALAQASMAPAAALSVLGEPLTSPRAALTDALGQLRAPPRA